MIEDGRGISQGHILSTQVCVVGAGAAGVTLALELAARGLDVILLEAGGLKVEQASDDDLAGEIAAPGHHAPLPECRSRQHRSLNRFPFGLITFPFLCPLCPLW
ncbi:FAD-dependent oxidoreductase [Candidatus Thiosymbion oneisti]|uniref:FAD-dependent oxidoreductase n=1 Tax=Candidatus Thiosymbion oneisti TaxID=589554 RepID=UPI000B7D517F|nr:FAD-dependent oxidoreductase [Candidatus Thiosymbion oneisti]